jgi:hypothetical protein
MKKHQAGLSRFAEQNDDRDRPKKPFGRLSEKNRSSRPTMLTRVRTRGFVGLVRSVRGSVLACSSCSHCGWNVRWSGVVWLVGVCYPDRRTWDSIGLDRYTCTHGHVHAYAARAHKATHTDLAGKTRCRRCTHPVADVRGKVEMPRCASLTCADNRRADNRRVNYNRVLEQNSEEQE